MNKTIQSHLLIIIGNWDMKYVHVVVQLHQYIVLGMNLRTTYNLLLITGLLSDIVLVLG